MAYQNPFLAPSQTAYGYQAGAMPIDDDEEVKGVRRFQSTLRDYRSGALIARDEFLKGDGADLFERDPINPDRFAEMLDPSTGKKAFVPKLGAQLENLRSTSQKKTGGLFSSGEPTPEARAAAQQLPDLEKQHRLKMERYQRLQADIDRAEQADIDAEKRLASIAARRMGLAAPGMAAPAPVARGNEPMALSPGSIPTGEYAKQVKAQPPMPLSPGSIPTGAYAGPTPNAVAKLHRQLKQAEASGDAATAEALRAQIGADFTQLDPERQQKVVAVTKDPTFWEQVGKTASNLAGDVPIALLKGAIGLGEAAVGGANIATMGMAGKAADFMGYKPAEAKQILSDAQSADLNAARRRVADAKGFLATAAAMAQNPSTIVDSVAESAPSMVGGAAVGRLAVGLAPAALTRAAALLSRTGIPITAEMVAAGLGEGAITAGQQAEQTRQETGTLTPGQAAIAVGTGLATSTLGIVGGRISGKLGLADVDEMLVRGEIGRAQHGLLKRVIGGAISEGMLEELPQSAQEQVAQNLATGKAWNYGVAEAAASGMVVGGVMGGGGNVMGGQSGGQNQPAPAPDSGGSPVAMAPYSPEQVDTAADITADPETGAPAEAFQFTSTDGRVLHVPAAGLREALAKLPEGFEPDMNQTRLVAAGAVPPVAPVAPTTSAPVDPATASPALDNPSSEAPTPSGAGPLSQEPPLGTEAAPPVTPPEQKPSDAGSTPAPATNLMREGTGGAGSAPNIDSGETLPPGGTEAGVSPAPVSNIDVAEPVEQRPPKPQVAGSTPAVVANSPAPRDFQVTVQQRQGTIPGYVQVDEIRDGQSVGSSNPFDARASGADIPDVPDWLPSGRYTLPELRAAIARGPEQAPLADAPSAQSVSAPVAPAADAAPSQPPASGSDQPQAPTNAQTPEPAQGVGTIARQAINRAQAEWVASGNADDPQGERAYVEAVAAIPDEIASQFEAHGSARGRNAQEMDAAGRLESVAKSGVKRGDFGTLKGESRGFSNTFTQAPFIVVRHKPTGREVIVWNRPVNDAVMPALRRLATPERQIIQASELSAWLNQQAATSTPSPRPANVSKKETKTDTSGEHAQKTPVSDTRPAPAPIVVRGANKPAEFVKSIAKATGLKQKDRALRAVGDLSVRLHRASPANFEGMEVFALSETEWSANPATGRMTPDSAAAYNPETNTLYLRTERVRDEKALVSAIVHESGHFAERFALPEALVAREWAKLTDAQIEGAAADYNGDDQRSAAQIRKDPRARSEWVAQQFARVVAGKAKTVPASIRAKLQEFFAAMKEFATKWLGSDFASSPAFDAEVLRVMGFTAEGTPSVVATASPASPAEDTPLMRFAKSKLPAASAARITSEAQVESYRAQFEKEQKAATPSAPPASLPAAAGVTSPQAARPKVAGLTDKAAQALDAAFDGLLGTPGTTDTITQRGIPPDKLPAFITAASALVESNVTTPAELARVLDARLGPKARPFAQAMWDAIGMVKPELRGTHDWQAVFEPKVESATAKVAPATGKVAEPATKKGRTGKPRFSYSPNAEGADLLDAIRDAGGVPRPPKGAKGGEWNGWQETFGKGSARLLVGSKVGGITEWLQDDLAPSAGRLYGIEDFYNAIHPAIDARNTAKERESKAERQAKFYAAALENKGRSFAEPKGEASNTSVLTGTSKFKVKGEEFRVVDFEETEDGYAVIAQDGDRFGTVTLPPGVAFYPDAGTLEIGSPETDAEFEAAVSAFELRDPTAEEKRAAGEAKRQREQREAITEKAAAPIRGDAGDQTRDMFGGGDMALFDAAQPNATVPPTPLVSNEPSPNPNLERDRGDAAAQNGGRAPSIRPERAGDAANDGGVGERIPGATEQAGAGDSAGASASDGDGGDSVLPERQPGAVGPGASIDGSEQPARGGTARGPRIVDVAGADAAVDYVAAKRPSVDRVAGERESTLAERIARQRLAESVPVIDLDPANIAETLPVLLPEQHDDVLKAERRFYEAKGRGILYTNGTGTGKTYTGLGIIKRFVRKGARDVLIVVPSSKKAMDWREDGERLGLDIGILEGITDAGPGLAVTTYANFRTNDALAARDFDLVVYDESHKLMENAEGERTSGTQRHQFITNHESAVVEKVAERVLGQKRPRGWEYPKEKFEDYQRDMAAWDARAREKKDEIAAEVARIKDKTRVVFLSATPFAYHKTLGYADGYLFRSPERTDKQRRTGYNEPQGFDRFLVENFGYRMRYNKLTHPEAEVNMDLMERAFADRLMKEGAMSGRSIDVPFDYSREFVLLDAGLGEEIDRGLGVLRGWIDRDQNGFRHLPDLARERFNYIYTMQLLEAVKVAQSIDRIRQHIAAGRKVILFHDYNNANPQHPFKGFRAGALSDAQTKEIDAFEARYPDLVNLDIGILRNPLALLAETFGEQAVFFNGTVSAGKRQKNVKAFNDDASPVKLLVAQSDAMAEGVSAHDMSGKHQRVVMNVGLPVKPTKAIQEEGRAYRVGVKSNAVYEYIVIHTSTEKYAFGSKINERVRTAENLALGSQARALQDSFKQGYLNPITAAPSDTQGRGGKEADRRAAVISEFDRAKTLYFSRQKKTQRTKSAEGVDYFATPEPIGLKMVEWAHVRPNEKMLEPSAGHGAIASFFPISTKNTYVEPSLELAEELRIKVSSGETIIGTFEDLNVVNKFDAIVLNPPFGQGGSTAMKHLAKAAMHLRDGGRIIALIPEGPSADAKFNKWFFDNPDTENLVKVAEFGLPNVVFERAGANVKTRIVVIDKVNNDEKRRATIERGRIDVSGETIGEVFDRIEQLSSPARQNPEADAASPLSSRDAVLPVASAPTPAPSKPSAKFETAEFPHTKTKKPIYVAKTGKLSDEEYRKASATARRHGGYYSSFKGMGAIPGLHFPTEQARADFLADMGASATLGTPADTAPEQRRSQSPRTEDDGKTYSRFQDSLRARGVPVERAPYEVRPQAAVAAEARQIIATQGEPAARAAALDRNSGVRGDTRLGIVGELLARDMDALQKSKPEDQPAIIARMDALAAASRDLNSTEAGQTVAMHAHIYKDARIASTMQHISETQKRQEQIIGPDGNTVVTDVLDELGKAAREAVDRMIANKADKLNQMDVGIPVWEKYRKDAASSLADLVDSKTKAPAAKAPLADFTGRIVAEIQARIAASLPERPAGAAKPSPMDVLTEAIQNKEKYRDVVATVREEFVTRYGEGSPELDLIDVELANLGITPYSRRTLDKAVKEAHEAMKVKIADLAKQHVTKTDKSAKDLAAALVAEAGLTGRDAKKLAADLDATARQMVAEARTKALDQMKARFEKGTTRAKKVFNAITKITTMNNLGALTRADLMQAVAKELKLPSVTPEALRKIADLADKVESAPNELARVRAEDDLMNGMRIVKGITAADVGLSVWFSNMLSGFTTHLANAQGNALLSTLQVGTLMATNPKNAGQAFAGWVDGLREGWMHGKDIIKTGRSLREMGEAKFGEAGNVLETVKYARDFERLPDALAYAFQKHAAVMKYVSRAMRAADAVFFYPAREAYARVATAKILAGQYQGKELHEKIRESLGIAPDQFIKWEKQATAEGWTGMDKALRVSQLIEGHREKTDASRLEIEQIGKATSDFAKESTLNQDPVGIAGAIYRNARNLTSDLPAMKVFLPFLRIPTNLFNTSLNFTPVGAVRAKFGMKDEAGTGTKQFTEEERARLYFQAVAGSLAMVGIAALAGVGDDEDDGEERFFDITANGTPDWRKNQQLEATGWRPFSIKVGDRWISYKDSPLLLPLSAVGQLRDAQKFQTAKDELLGKSAELNALMKFPQTIFQTSMLSGLGTVMDVANGTSSPDKLEGFLANTATAAVIPNLVKQADRLASPETRESDGVAGRLGQAVPGLRQTGTVKTDVLGEPVTRSPMDRFSRAEPNDPLREVLRDKQVFISVPSRSTKLPGGAIMDEDQYREFVRISGEGINARLQPYVASFRRADPERVEKIVETITRQERDRAKMEVWRAARAAQ